MHDFWLIREGERQYTDYWDLLGRTEAPVRFPDDLLWYLHDTLSWIPTVNPSLPELPADRGLNLTGPTVINQTGGALFHQVCTAWSQLFAQGPEQLILRGAYGWPGLLSEMQLPTNIDELVEFGDYQQLEVGRDWLVATLSTLAEFGEQAATGQFFIFHLGI